MSEWKSATDTEELGRMIRMAYQDASSLKGIAEIAKTIKEAIKYPFDDMIITITEVFQFGISRRTFMATLRSPTSGAIIVVHY